MTCKFYISLQGNYGISVEKDEIGPSHGRTFKLDKTLIEIY